jgi:hypothetical protein
MDSHTLTEHVVSPIINESNELSLTKINRIDERRAESAGNTYPCSSVLHMETMTSYPTSDTKVPCCMSELMEEACRCWWGRPYRGFLGGWCPFRIEKLGKVR